MLKKSVMGAVLTFAIGMSGHFDLRPACALANSRLCGHVFSLLRRRSDRHGLRRRDGDVLGEVFQVLHGGDQQELGPGAGEAA